MGTILVMGLVSFGYLVAWAGANNASLWDGWNCRPGTKPGTTGGTAAPTDCKPRDGDIPLGGGFIWRPQNPGTPPPKLPDWLKQIDLSPNGRNIDRVNNFIKQLNNQFNSATAGANGILVGPCLPGSGGGGPGGSWR